MKYLLANKTTTGQEKNVTPVASWGWSAQMVRFKPFIKSAPTNTNIASLPGTSQSTPHPNQDVESESEDNLDNPDIGQTDLNSELLFEEDPEQDTTIFLQKITMIIV